MATAINGMTSRETADLTRAMVYSGGSSIYLAQFALQNIYFKIRLYGKNTGVMYIKHMF